MFVKPELAVLGLVIILRRSKNEAKILAYFTIKTNCTAVANMDPKTTQL